MAGRGAGLTKLPVALAAAALTFGPVQAAWVCEYAFALGAQTTNVADYSATSASDNMHGRFAGRL